MPVYIGSSMFRVSGELIIALNNDPNMAQLRTGNLKLGIDPFTCSFVAESHGKLWHLKILLLERAKVV